MIALMTPGGFDMSSGDNYWPGSGIANVMPNGFMEPADHQARSMSRKTSYDHPGVQFSNNGTDSSSSSSSAGDEQPQMAHFDSPQVATLVIRPHSTTGDQASKAPLAPKQGMAGSLASSKTTQLVSPISGTYALRTPRGKITSIACESCRKRKSKCDGVRPRCNTCQAKNLPCLYDMADGKTTTQLRAHVKRLERELHDVKSLLTPLAMASNRAAALQLAQEVSRNGFARHSAKAMSKTLMDSSQNQHSDGGSSENDVQMEQSQSLAASSYDSSSRDHSQDSSQSGSQYSLHHNVEPPALPFSYVPNDPAGRFSFDCAFYRRTKRELLANEWEPHQIFGRGDVDVDSILLGFSDAYDGQTVPTWSSRTAHKMLANHPLPIQLASAYLLTKMMKWMIWPSVENMNELPEWLMPLARQDCTPYDILVDLIPWPGLRQHLYDHPTEFRPGAFIGFICINWPFPNEACHYWDMEAGCTRLTPVFQAQIADLNSWSMDPKALQVMPSLVGMVPIHSG